MTSKSRYYSKNKFRKRFKPEAEINQATNEFMLGVFKSFPESHKEWAFKYAKIKNRWFRLNKKSEVIEVKLNSGEWLKLIPTRTEKIRKVESKQKPINCKKVKEISIPKIQSRFDKMFGELEQGWFKLEESVIDIKKAKTVDPKKLILLSTVSYEDALSRLVILNERRKSIEL